MTKTIFPITTLADAGVQIIDGDRGFAYPKSSDFMESGHCLFLSAQNVTADGFKFNEMQFVSEEKHNELRKGALQRQDIVLTSRGTVGNVALYDDRISYDVLRVNSGMLVLRNSGKSFKTDYLYVLLRSPLFKKQIRRLSFGSAQPQITVHIINDFEFPCPSKPEQKKIAEIISMWDEAIETLVKLIDAKTKLKKGLMQMLLTGKMRFDGFKDDKWVDIQIKDIGKVVTGNTPPKSDITNYGTIFSWATADDLKNKYVMDTVVKLSEKGKSFCRTVPKGSVLVTCIASIGKNAIAGENLATNQQINAIIVDQDKYDNEIIYYFMELHKRKMLALAGKTAVPIINKSTFEKVHIHLPENIVEQRAISRILSCLDQEMKIMTRTKNKFINQKKGLMQKLLTGKIRVKEAKQ